MSGGALVQAHRRRNFSAVPAVRCLFNNLRIGLLVPALSQLERFVVYSRRVGEPTRTQYTGRFCPLTRDFREQGHGASYLSHCQEADLCSSGRFLGATSFATTRYPFAMASHQAFRRRVSEDSISLRADRSKASLDAFRNRSLFQFSVLANSGTESLAGLNGERDPRALSLSKGQHEPSPVS